MLDTEAERLARKVRKTLESGSSIAVVGWIASNHNDFTRGLWERKIVFLENSDTIEIPKRVGLVLFTRFVNHTMTSRVRGQVEIHPGVVHLGQIKKALEFCADLLQKPHHINNDVETSTASPATQPKSIQSSQERVLNIEMEPRKEQYMSSREKFAKDFIEASCADSEHRVNRIALGRLRNQNGIEETAIKLVRTGWLLSLAGSSGKIGWYKAGPKLLAAASLPSQAESADPIERAKFLVAQKQELLSEKGQLESWLQENAEKLSRIEAAEKLLMEYNQTKERLLARLDELVEKPTSQAG